MAAKWIELVTGSLEQKKQYKQSKARLDALPEPYRDVATAFNRYFMYYGGVTEGTPSCRCSRTSRTCGNAPPSTARP